MKQYYVCNYYILLLDLFRYEYSSKYSATKILGNLVSPITNFKNLIFIHFLYVTYDVSDFKSYHDKKYIYSKDLMIIIR